jgi:biotin synthase
MNAPKPSPSTARPPRSRALPERHLAAGRRAGAVRAALQRPDVPRAEAHRAHFPAGDVELATLLSIKTGGCEEDCGYCPQAARYDTGVEAKKILDIDTVLDAARQAKASGATRFCMGAAWRSPKERDMEKVEEMVREVKALGMETCATLGMLEEGQADS